MIIHHHNFICPVKRYPNHTFCGHHKICIDYCSPHWRLARLLFCLHSASFDLTGCIVITILLLLPQSEAMIASRRRPIVAIGIVVLLLMDTADRVDCQQQHSLFLSRSPLRFIDSDGHLQRRPTNHVGLLVGSNGRTSSGRLANYDRSSTSFATHDGPAAPTSMTGGRMQPMSGFGGNEASPGPSRPRSAHWDAMTSAVKRQMNRYCCIGDIFCVLGRCGSIFDGDH